MIILGKAIKLVSRLIKITEKFSEKTVTCYENYDIYSIYIVSDKQKNSTSFIIRYYCSLRDLNIVSRKYCEIRFAILRTNLRTHVSIEEYR